MINHKNRRVLIIDDNRAIHEDFRKILARDAPPNEDVSAIEDSLFGESTKTEHTRLDLFAVSAACQGQEGFEMVRRACQDQQPFALAFIDIRMPPGWDGVQTTAEIWKIDPDLQVIICSAYSDYSWSEMMAKLPRSDRLVILKKPFDNIEVAQLAETLSTKWDLIQQARRKTNELEALVQQRTGELTEANRALRTENEHRKIMESERQVLEGQLRQSQKLEAIGQLAAGIAHEINTPTQYMGDNTRFIGDSWEILARVLTSHQELMRAIKEQTITVERIQAAEQLLHSADLEFIQKHIPQAIRATLDGVERVAKIVRAMKEFAHPASREKAFADLNHAIETTVTVARNEWKHVADLKLDLDPSLPMTCCFLDGFNQSVLNLVVNAAHAVGDAVKANADRKGTIAITTRSNGDHVEVRVSDNGTGIPESARSHIFEPFFTTKEVGKGTGQGLSIVYASIVKDHGGEVAFETELGRGTTFILRLPTTAPKTALQKGKVEVLA